jgi:hypothetical protein
MVHDGSRPLPHGDAAAVTVRAAGADDACCSSSRRLFYFPIKFASMRTGEPLAFFLLGEVVAFVLGRHVRAAASFIVTCQPPTDAALKLSHWRHCRFQCDCGKITGPMSRFATIKLPKSTVRSGEKVRCASPRKVPA